MCGADDMQLRVYNYNTMDKVKTFEAHTDYIRCDNVVTQPPSHTYPASVKVCRSSLSSWSSV